MLMRASKELWPGIPLDINFSVRQPTHLPSAADENSQSMPVSKAMFKQPAVGNCHGAYNLDNLAHLHPVVGICGTLTLTLSCTSSCAPLGIQIWARHCRAGDNLGWPLGVGTPAL